MIEYTPWKKDLQIHIRELVLTASQELQLQENWADLEHLQIVKSVSYLKYEISAELAL